MNKHSLPVWVLLLSSVGWGLAWLPLQYFESQGLSGPVMVFISFAAATLVLLPLLIGQRIQWWEDLRSSLLILIFGGLANLLFQLAMFYGDVVRVMILFYLLPVWSVLGGRIFLGESIDWVRWLTLLSAIAGGILILGGWQVFSGSPTWLDLMAIGSGFAFAMNNIVFRVAQDLPLGSKVGAMFSGVVLFVGTYLILGPQQPWPQSESTYLYASLYGIAWVTLISFGTQWGVTQLEAGRASIIIVMELVIAVVSSMIILSHDLSTVEITGALLVVSAAIIEGFRDQITQPQTCRSA